MQEELGERSTFRNDPYKRSRFYHILEAAFEYFISLLTVDAYIARVATAVGMSDSTTGILTAFVSLGCGTQIFALFFARRRSVKSIVTVGHTLNQLCFTLVYLTPLLPDSFGNKSTYLLVFLLAGHLIANVIHAPKINWFMNLVDDKERGVFTANKEIVSLIGGMTFSFVMGRVIDGYTERGNENGAFTVCAITIFVLTLLHTLTLLLSKEKIQAEDSPEEAAEKVSLKSILSEKTLRKVIFVSILRSIAVYATTPFYGTYQNKELGFTMTFVSVLSIVYSITRALVSRPIGKFADKKSFRVSLTLCYAIEALGMLCVVFTVPGNGKIFFTAYKVLNAVSMAGINSGEINLIYDYVPKEKRMTALALKCSIAGIIGFLTTLAVSPLVDYIQAQGNTFLGMPLYAQQVVSVIGLVITLVIILYLNTVVKKIRQN